jgi:hypothetical protein
MGLDGSGSVSSVANISPDGDGNVPLTAADVGALPSTGGDLTGALRMNGQPISGLNAPTKNDHAANMGFVNSVAAPYNYAHNSNFTKFIAQAGIGGKHSETAYYAGDRWILDSGTVTGVARADGNGYTNITLNGTIRQIVENAPDVGTAAIEMVSGTADISYETGEITITSNGGVIRNVRLLKGAYPADNVPNYQPKSYSAELMECMRYFYRQQYSVGGYPGYANSATIARCTLLLPVEMRVVPSMTIGNMGALIINPGGKAVTGTSCYVNIEDKKQAVFDFTTSGLTSGQTVFVRLNGADIALSADL